MPLPRDYADSRVCIIGLGYVGLTLAVAMADVGFQVVGIEISDDVLDHLRQGRAHFLEIGLDEKLESLIRRGRFKFHQRMPEQGGGSVYIITVGTPVDDNKKTQLQAITAVAAEVAKVLKAGDLVILRSTVRLGVTRQVVKPILDAKGVPYQLAFCPERTLEGKALQELRSLPQIIGSIDQATALRASQLFNFLTPTIVRVSDLETAEMIKLVNNTQRDLLFAFANEVAAMADVMGVSAIEVINASNSGYPRGMMPRPGPVAGPCLSKDPYILAEGLAQYDYTPRLAIEARRLNEAMPKDSVAQMADLLAARSVDTRGATIAVLGLTFKGEPETSDLRGSLAIPIIAELKRTFPAARLVGYDPALKPDEIATLGIEPVGSLEGAFQGAALVAIQNNHREFGRMRVRSLSSRMARCGVIYDYWNQLHGEEHFLENGVTYVGLGTLGRPMTAEEHLDAAE
jgi:nucleotide sugar dehydrogenase